MVWPTHGTAPQFSGFGALISKQTTSPQGTRLQAQFKKSNHCPKFSRFGSTPTFGQRPQFHMGPIGVCVQQGPKPPPFHRP